MSTDAVPDHREVCRQCRRPQSVCYCSHITPIDSRTRVVLLQHPRERDKAIGTAHMASLCLTNSELHVGVDFERSKDLDRVLAAAHGNVALLYPDDEAKDVSCLSKDVPLTLVVVDGTWWQARKMVRRNPKLLALPRVAFTPPRPSEYRIRKEPADECVSTIEALMYVLGAIEGAPERFESLLAPFRAMIDAQIDCRDRLHGARTRTRKHPRERKSPIPACFRERRDDLVCVIGEANAWPYCCPERGSLYPDELVHWVACRPSTGERFDYVIAPSHPLAENTTKHIRLTAEQLAQGGTLPGLVSDFDAFLRPSDILCCWGHYATALYAKSGGALPKERIDLRPLTHAVEQRRFGALEDYPGQHAVAPHPTGNGRANLRLDKLTQVVLDYSSR